MERQKLLLPVAFKKMTLGIIPLEEPFLNEPNNSSSFSIVLKKVGE